MQAMTGTHLLLQTDEGVIEIHVGPSDFIASEGFEFAEGDEVEVIGSRITQEEADAIVAREIKKGDATLVLRDQDGLPRWSRQRSAS